MTHHGTGCLSIKNKTQDSQISLVEVSLFILFLLGIFPSSDRKDLDGFYAVKLRNG